MAARVITLAEARRARLAKLERENREQRARLRESKAAIAAMQRELERLKGDSGPGAA